MPYLPIRQGIKYNFAQYYLMPEGPLVIDNRFNLPLIPLQVTIPGNTRTATYRHLLGLALRADAIPEQIAIKGLPSEHTRLSPSAFARIELIAEQQGMDIRSAFAGLCAAGEKIYMDNLNQAAGIAQEIASQLPMPFTPKSDNQRQFYENVMIGLQHRQIVFAEGSTGIGKSRVIAAAAIHAAQSGMTPVIIAAPTIAVMEQLYNELQTVGPKDLSCIILPGASEFVDDLALSAYLETAQTDPLLPYDQNQKIASWVEKGAPPIKRGPLAQSIGHDAAWLMSDLRELAPDIPNDFTLQSGQEEGEARKLVVAIRKRAHDNAHIIFCTHTMLAIGQKTQWRALPAPKVLFIDEAHLFEQTLSQINSDQLSIFALLVELLRYQRKNSLGNTSSAALTVKLARNLMKSLQDIELDNQRQVCMNTMEDTTKKSVVIRDLEDLGKKLKSKTLSDMPRQTFFQNGLNNILQSLRAQQAFSNNPTNRVNLVFSDDRRYPSLLCGPSKLAAQMGDIWKQAKGGVALISATLYIMDSYGNTKCDYLRGLLEVNNFGRLYTPAPVIDRSIYDLPTLYIPEEPEQARLLCPPKSRGSTAETKWHDALIRTISNIVQDARGGTLVLTTAYQDIQALEKGLIAAGVSQERLVVQERNKKFRENEQDFRQRHREGKKPILLALGTAWTGIDLKEKDADGESDVPEEQDFLLTDLVITRLPVGLNSSNSMLSRIEQTRTLPIINEALLTFKQGLGRLIRRANVTDRRLWVLDGRIFSTVKWPGMEPLVGGSRQLLREYGKRGKIVVPD